MKRAWLASLQRQRGRVETSPVFIYVRRYEYPQRVSPIDLPFFRSVWRRRAFDKKYYCISYLRRDRFFEIRADRTPSCGRLRLVNATDIVPLVASLGTVLRGVAAGVFVVAVRMFCSWRRR